MSLRRILGRYLKRFNVAVRELDVEDSDEKVTTGTTLTFRVPEGKMWYVLNGACNRGDAGTLLVYGYRPNDLLKDILAVETSATGISSVPSYLYPHFHTYYGGDYIQATFGAAQTSGNSYLRFTVIEMEMS